ncbi:hypothetical protein PSI17_14735 [Xenorhabdus sp. IM139775]|nr:hypothetical protein [Xenorhabdus sp. IM139775]MDC9594823.1 hypothetical protein [Xenorhabdus sp. IM139775]
MLLCRQFTRLINNIADTIKRQVTDRLQCAASVVHAVGGDGHPFAALGGAAAVVPMPPRVDIQRVTGLDKSLLVIDSLLDIKPQVPQADQITQCIFQVLCRQLQIVALHVPGLVIDAAGRLHGQLLIRKQLAPAVLQITPRRHMQRGQPLQQAALVIDSARRVHSQRLFGQQVSVTVIDMEGGDIHLPAALGYPVAVIPVALGTNIQGVSRFEKPVLVINQLPDVKLQTSLADDLAFLIIQV